MSHVDAKNLRSYRGTKKTRTGSLGLIARLPRATRAQIGERLRDNCLLIDLARWLLQEPCPIDFPNLKLTKGEPYGKLWADAKNPLIACRDCLSTYRYSPTYNQWLAQVTRSDTLGEMLRKLDAIAKAGGDSTATIDGVNRVALSLVADKLDKATDQEIPTNELKELTHTLLEINRAMLASQKAELDARKVALMEQEHQAAHPPKVKLSPEEKQRRYRQIFGLSDDYKFPSSTPAGRSHQLSAVSDQPEPERKLRAEN